MAMAPSRRARPTQGDVAREANVSQSAVSAVLRGDPLVAIAPDTRQRILDAVDRLAYVPNSAAQGLRSNRTMTVACVIPDITNPFYPAFERGAQMVANGFAYDFAVYNTDGVRAGELRCLRLLRGGRVDGIIVAPFQIDAGDLVPLVELGLPVISFGQLEREPNEIPYDSVFVDDVAGVAAMVDHLVRQGHTRIGMIAGLPNISRRDGRVRGYHAALARHGLDGSGSLVRGDDYTEIGGYQAMRRLLANGDRPSAVFAANDLMAIGAINAARDAGLKVPADIAVAGFDDIPFANLLYPALTTVAQFPQDLGRRAAELLFDRVVSGLEGPGRRVEMPFKLIVRSSA